MDECITDDKNILKNNAQMKPPSTISSMINDHVDHFVTVPYGQKIPKEHNNNDQDQDDNSNNNNDDDPDPDDEIRAAMISIMSSQTSLIKNGFRENLKNIEDNNNEEEEDNDNDDQNNSNNNDFTDEGLQENLDNCQQQLQQIQLSNPSTIIFPNQKQSENINDNYIIIIDDLFVRKFLHQICPKYFDETWLERFKSQYLNSFLLNEEDNDDDENNHEDDNNDVDYKRNKQKQILDKILSTNQLTIDDEFLVYWKLNEHHHNNLHHNNLNNNHINFNFNKMNDDNELMIPKESWLQHRDPMTYLYNFCELLMFVEMKFDDQKQKDRCQQLAREIRAYLYWISKDERFKEDSIEQEQLARLASSNTNTNASSSPQEPNYTNNDDGDVGVGGGGNVGAEQKLFNSIVQHILMICYEVMITANILSHHDLNPTVITFVEQKEQKKFFQIIYQILENLSNKNNVELKSSSTTTLYSQWMKNLNNILIALVEYYELNPMFSIKQNDCNNNNLPQHQTLDGVDDEDNNVIGGGGVARSTTKTSIISSVSSTTTTITTITNNNNNNSSNKIKYFDHQHNNNSSNNLIVQPSSSSSMMMDSSASSTISNTIPSSVNAVGHHHHSFHPLASSSPHNNSNNNGGGTSSTNVERHNSTTSSSGPSSGVGSLDSSAHHSSSYHRDLFASSSPSVIGSGGTQKYLPSSASMTPSPANFANATSPLTTTTNTTTTEDNNLAMLLQLNQLEDLESLMDNHQQQDQGMPKLIAPQMPPRLLDNNNIDAQETFGFDFNSLNNPNRRIMIDKQKQDLTFDQNSEFLFCNQTNGVAGGNGTEHNGVTTNNTNGNGNFFHEFNITSLFSSFDDNVSTGAESGTITDGFNATMVPNNTNNTTAAAVSTMAIKHYPDPSEESAIQLPNQCFTMTLDQPKQFRHSTHNPATTIPKPIVVGSAQQQYVSPVCPPLNTPPLIQPQPLQQQTSNGTDHQIASSPMIDDLCERQTLYRLIISQLLFDGHRNIACQVAVAEHIKCDSFLIGPSQELHKLVSFAKNKKKEDILMDKSVDHTPAPINATPGFGRTNSSGSTYYDSVGSNNNNNGIGSPTAQTSPAKMLTSSQTTSPYSLRMEDPYSKAIFEHPSNVPVGSHLNFVSNANNGQQQLSNTPHTSTSTQNNSSILDYGDLNSSATDLYSPSSGPTMDYYFQSTRSPDIHGSMFNKSPTTNPNINDLQSRQMVVGSQRGGSMKCLQSVESTHPLANVNANELVLTEACLKNINQLAKLNSSGETTMATGNQNNSNSTSMNNPLLGSGPSPGSGTSNQAVMFGRSASAMAMTTTNSNGSVVLNNHPGAIGSTNNLSRSPLTIKSPTGYPATHTTGNGKNHQIMQIVYKFGSLGQLKSQFSSPHGFCLGTNDEIIIADTNNHRICSYDKNGVFKQMFGTPGKDEGQLWYPRKITMIPQNFVRNTLNSPYYVICDRGMERSRMQIFTRNGNFVRKIPIRYIDIVAGIAINSRGHIVVVDSVSPTIYVITIDNGTLIEWRDCGDYMREPSDVAIYDDDYYICDFKGHCVVVIKSNGEFLRKIGMEGLTSFPNGIDISPNGDIFVGDSHGNKFHVVVFNRDGRLLAEYECPYCKVSRCCGLKLTKDNNIVTLAKNNHHVLVLNPNFQQQQPLQQLQQTQQNLNAQ